MRYVARRLLLYIPMLLLLTLLVFVLMRVIPGDPALLILAGSGEGSFSQQELANLRRELGTDRPIFVQYRGLVGWPVAGQSRHLAVLPYADYPRAQATFTRHV